MACQAPLAMEFFRQEYWSGLLFPSPGDLTDLGIELTSYVSCIGRQILYHWCPPGFSWHPISVLGGGGGLVTKLCLTLLRPCEL